AHRDASPRRPGPAGSMTALLLTLLALQAPLDEGTFLIRQDTAEIGREAFRLTAARGGAGWTLASTVRYDRSPPIAVLNPFRSERIATRVLGAPVPPAP